MKFQVEESFINESKNQKELNPCISLNISNKNKRATVSSTGNKNIYHTEPNKSIDTKSPNINKTSMENKSQYSSSAYLKNKTINNRMYSNPLIQKSKIKKSSISEFSKNQTNLLKNKDRFIQRKNSNNKVISLNNINNEKSASICITEISNYDLNENLDFDENKKNNSEENSDFLKRIYQEQKKVVDSEHDLIVDSLNDLASHFLTFKNEMLNSIKPMIINNQYNINSNNLRSAEMINLNSLMQGQNADQPDNDNDYDNDYDNDIDNSGIVNYQEKVNDSHKK